VVRRIGAQMESENPIQGFSIYQSISVKRMGSVAEGRVKIILSY
jgi:hypothetical protein